MTCVVSLLITCVFAGIGFLRSAVRFRRRQKLNCAEPRGKSGLEAFSGAGGGAVVAGGGGSRDKLAFSPDGRRRRVLATLEWHLLLISFFRNQSQTFFVSFLDFMKIKMFSVFEILISQTKLMIKWKKWTYWFPLLPFTILIYLWIRINNCFFSSKYFL